MEYTLHRSKRKTIAIIIRDGKVIVRAPYHSRLDEIEAFLSLKSDWLNKKLAEYREIGINEEKDEVYLFAKKYKIIYEEDDHIFIEYKKDKIIIHAALELSKEKKLNHLEKDLKEKLYQKIDFYLDKYSRILQIKKPPYKIRKYKRIHGRCSNQGELAFNAYLYEHSLEFIEYVVLHECAHLFEFNHSKRFYQIIEKHMPNYKDIILEDKNLLSPHLDR